MAALTTLKIAIFAPIPSASVISDTAVRVRFLHNSLAPYRGLAIEYPSAASLGCCPGVVAFGLRFAVHYFCVLRLTWPGFRANVACILAPLFGLSSVVLCSRISSGAKTLGTRAGLTRTDP